MNKAKQGFRINLTTRKTESLKKFLSTVLASVMVFYMCSINLLTVELMTARADELNDKAGSSVTSSSDSNSNSDSPSNSNDNSKNENANSDDKVSETPKDDNSNKNDNFKVNDSNSNENTNADSVSSESSQTVQPDTPADNGETPAQDSNTNDNQSGTPTQDNLGNPTVNPTASDSATTIANDNVVLDTTVTAPVPQENGDLNTFVAPNTKASSVDLDSINPENISTAKLATDKADYYSTDTAIITGTGFIPGQTYILKISSSDTPPTSKSVEVTADENGQFVYAYQFDGTYRPDYTVVAKNTDGDVIAKTSFTDPAAPTTTTMNSLSTPIVAGSTGNAWSGSVTPAGITNVDVELRYVSSSASCPDGTGGPGSDGTKLTTPAPVKTSNSTFSGTFTAPAAGTYKFFAKFKGNPSYAKSYSTCQTITVNASGKIAQSITFGALSDKTYGNADFTVSATATSGCSWTNCAGVSASPA